MVVHSLSIKKNPAPDHWLLSAHWEAGKGHQKPRLQAENSVRITVLLRSLQRTNCWGGFLIQLQKSIEFCLSRCGEFFKNMWHQTQPLCDEGRCEMRAEEGEEGLRKTSAVRRGSGGSQGQMHPQDGKLPGEGPGVLTRAGCFFMVL